MKTIGAKTFNKAIQIATNKLTEKGATKVQREMLNKIMIEVCSAFLVDDRKCITLLCDWLAQAAMIWPNDPEIPKVWRTLNREYNEVYCNEILPI